MARESIAEDRIDIATIEDLRQAIRRVVDRGESVVVTIDGAEALLRPVPGGLRRRTPEQQAADDAAFRSAAGSLKGLIDPDEFKRQLREARGKDPLEPEKFEE
jgi:hypothetical protein